MHSELHQRGLTILAFPCNQFLSQEPQGAEKIETCVRAKYSLGFQLMEKVDVNGKNTHPVFRWLRLRATPDASAIKWNFNMVRRHHTPHTKNCSNDKLKTSALYPPEATSDALPLRTPFRFAVPRRPGR